MVRVDELAVNDGAGMAVVGLLIPLVGLVGALRLGRPNSLWARLYRERKMARARARLSVA